MVNVYTDASLSDSIAVVSCFQLTDTDFLGYCSNTYHDVTCGLHGELLGIRDGIKYALETREDVNEDIVILTDSHYALKLLNEGKQNRAAEIEPLLVEIKDLMSKHGVLVDYVKGHQLVHNPNKVVDLVSKRILRCTLKGELKR